jgi:hypothetical protein
VCFFSLLLISGPPLGNSLDLSGEIIGFLTQRVKKDIGSNFFEFRLFFEGFQDLLVMPSGVDPPDDTGDEARLIDNDGVPMGELVPLDSIGPGDGMVIVYQERKGELELFFKGLMATRIVEAHPQDLRLFALKLSVGVPEIACLDGATRGVVLRVEIKDHIFFTFKITKFYRVSVFILGREFRRRFSFCDTGHGASFKLRGLHPTLHPVIWQL